jgi:hypothetical protein
VKPDPFFYSLLSDISTMTVLIPFIVGLLLRRYLNPAERVLLWLITITIPIELVCYMLSRKGIPNLLIYRGYTVLEFTLISMFYIRFMSPSRMATVLKIQAFIFLVVAGLDLSVNGPEALDQFSTTTESVLLILYSVIAFFYLLQNPVQMRVIDIPVFWFNTAVLLYFSGNLFVFIFSNYIEQHSSHAFSEMWSIHSIMNIVFYILISIGFWKTKAR